MGFGGATAAMIASLKNNNRRKKREPFSHLSGKTDSKSKGIKVEPVTEEVLEKIRQKIKRQNRITSIKMTIIIFVSFGIVVWMFL